MSNIATFNSLLMNMTSYSANSSMRKKRIKAPESLRSPLTPIWIEPIETWRALVTEDVLTDNNSKQDSSSMKRNQTMHLADLSSLSNNLASLNIFSGLRLLNRSNTTNEQQQQQSAADETRVYDSKKVSDELRVVRSRLTNPIYMKSGPGYDDFGYVSTQELIKVKRMKMRVLSVLCVCSLYSILVLLGP